LQSPCTNDSTCTAAEKKEYGKVENSVCANAADPQKRKCKCKDGFAETGNLCSRVLQSPCTNDSTCTAAEKKEYGKVENSVCANATDPQKRKCKCKDGFAETGNLCSRVLQSPCTNDSTCTAAEKNEYGKVDNSVCANTTNPLKRMCKCKDGFAETGNLCSRVLQSPCTNDSTCTAAEKKKYGKVDNSMCANTTNPLKRICKCKDGFAETGNLCSRVLQSPCTNDSTCTAAEKKEYGKVENSVCANTTNTLKRICKCKDGFAETGNLCSRVLQSPCTNDSTCTAAEKKEYGKVENSVCANATDPQKRKCKCKDGFAETGNLCSRVLQSPCTNDSTCTAAEKKEYGKVENSVCANATDPQKRKCKCKDGFAETGNFCSRVLQSPCTNDSTCTAAEKKEYGKVDNSMCANTTNPLKRICKCKDGFAETGNLCSRVLQSPCTNDSTCTAAKKKEYGKVENSVCANTINSLKRKCKCKDGFAERGNLCSRVLNSTCTNDSTCTGADKEYGKVENSVCANTTDSKERICKCKDGFAETGNLCSRELRMAINLNSSAPKSLYKRFDMHYG
ncbi:protein eyes shut homolog, partial [Mercenaria mercenaria]|uniref:protein eyes shut homolog n=1 Tax=Mercenaria mercenaria TaxID=6596 RepID=UPI00234F8F9D